MSQSTLDGVSQTQKERLFHLDFKLRFLGVVNRNDLVSRFGIKAAAATRDISLYKEIAPKNLIYDTRAKSYIQADTFNSVFKYESHQALLALCHGVGDDHVGLNNALITAEAPTQLNLPNLDTLAAVTKAIHHKTALKIEYRSLSSGLTKREITPFAIVDNGLRWHVRAFDRKHERFTDFVINRIAKPKLLEGTVPFCQTRDADKQWNRIVEMHIVPHPNLKHPETISAEYNMDNNLLIVETRAAVAGYLLRKWSIDCSIKHTLSGPEYHLWLQNTATLYGVENLSLAPGYHIPYT